MRTRILSAAAAVLLICPALHAQTALPALPSLQDVQANLAAKAPKHETLRVWLEIRPEGELDYTVADPFLRIRFDGDSFDGKDYRFWGRADQEHLSFRAEPSFFDAEDADLSGDGIALKLEKEFGWEGDYRLTGTVSGTLQGKPYQQRVDLRLDYNESWQAFFIEAPGVQLRLDMGSRLELNGTVERARFGRKALSALAAAAVMIHRQALRPEEPRPEEEREDPPPQEGPVSEAQGED